jgi:GT2 family glycosyltransferase
LTDLILLTYNHSDLTLKCLESLKANTKSDIRPIWIDNGSGDEHYWNVHNRILDLFPDNNLIISLSVNMGFAAGMNEGIKASDSDFVVLLNNDLEFTPHWLGWLLKPFELDPKIGIVGSMTDHISTVQQVDRFMEKFGKKYDGQIWKEHNTGNVAYFCVALRRAMIDDIGLLDEKFFNGGEDDDYNDRARLAEWKTGFALKSKVYHKHLATRKDPELGYRENNQRNREYLKQKRNGRKNET